MPDSRPIALIALVATGLLAGCGSSSATSSGGAPAATRSATRSASAGAGSSTGAPSAQIGFEGVAIEAGGDLASAGSTGRGSVDGIACAPVEQLAYHIHAHLQVFVRGQSRALPGGIGIPGSQVVPSAEGPVATGGQCIYWLHTHAPDGVIHIESPTARIYTLGDFFDEWRQPLGPQEVAGAIGPVHAIVDGRPWKGNPRAIPLHRHAVIQLAVGSPPVAFRSMLWPNTGL